MEVLFSVIVPVYNTESNLGQCLDSLLVQSYENFEIIIIDDGSTDGSGYICDLYKEKDSRIKVIHKKNGGVSSARNYGIKEAKGQYIVFVDSDDFVDIDYLKSFIPSISERVLTVQNGTNIIHEKENINETEILDFDVRLSNSICYKFIKLYNSVLLYSSVWNKVFIRDILFRNSIRFSELIHNGEDRLFVSDYLLCPDIEDIFIIKKMGYNYLLRNGSITHSKIKVKSFCLSTLTHYSQFKRIIEKYEISDEAFITSHFSLFKMKFYEGILLLVKTNLDKEYKDMILKKTKDILKELKRYHTNKKLDFLFSLVPFNMCISLIKIIVFYIPLLKDNLLKKDFQGKNLIQDKLCND